MPNSDSNRLLHGLSDPLPEQRWLRAGPLTLIFEAGDLRYVTLGRRELVRRIYGAVRDANWGTVPGALSDVAIANEEDRFKITYRSDHRYGPIDFVWHGRIDGRPDGTITFDFAGEARSTFARNRIGLCVLHPMHPCAGSPVTIRHTDGTLEEGRFPELVAIEQPVEGFGNIRAMTHEAVRDVRMEITFEGDTFETEDQRNWIDASFKTYSTPLSLPRPVVVSKGTRVEQRVTLRLHGAVRGTALNAPAPRTRASRRQRGQPSKVPAVGIGFRGVGGPPSGAAIERLRDLKPAHLRVDLPLATADWKARLERALHAAGAAGCGLELALTIGGDDGPGLDSLATLLPRDVRPCRLLVFAADPPTTTGEALELVRERLLAKRSDLGLAGVGTTADLYQLHLYPPPAADLIAWSMNPHAHASDVTSLSETPPAAFEQVSTMRQRHPNALLAITPVTLAPRRAPAAAPRREPHPLHASLLGAAWTLGVGAHVAAAGAGSITFFDAVEDLGVAAPTVFPLYHVLADLCDCAGGTAVPVDNGTDEHALLLVRRVSDAVLLVANLSRHPQTVPLPEAFTPVRMRVLDEASAGRAASDPREFRTSAGQAPRGRSIELGPFATARLDGR